MTRYKLELEFDAESSEEASDFIDDYELTFRPNPQNEQIAYVIFREVGGAFKMEGHFKPSAEPQPLPAWTHRESGIDQYVVNAAEPVATPRAGLDPTVAALAGL